jgi:uncharacterized protein
LLVWHDAAVSDERDDGRDLAAGNFSSWLTEVQGAIRGDRDAEVPCDGCTACCTSSQFVHIGPDETDTLSCVPAELLFPAPRMPPGHVLLGYDERGHCPMLIDNECSIYEHRPRTCRSYDCRVFAATGIEPDLDQPLVAERARRWRFDFPTPFDREARDAVRVAATSAPERTDGRPANATGRAVHAIESHVEFLGRRERRPRSS